MTKEQQLIQYIQTHQKKFKIARDDENLQEIPDTGLTYFHRTISTFYAVSWTHAGVRLSVDGPGEGVQGLLAKVLWPYALVRENLPILHAQVVKDALSGIAGAQTCLRVSQR